MKAVVYKEPKEVATETVDHPKIERPTDALIKITTTNICGPDLHSYGGRVGLEEGRIVGHENQGEVIEVGDAAKDSNTPPPLPVSAPLLGYTQSQVLLTLPLVG